MTRKLKFYSSLEGAQHGGKPLRKFTEFAANSGCRGCQPSIYHIIQPDGSLMEPDEIKEALLCGGIQPIRLDGFSAHCPAWVLLAAELDTKGSWPFIPADLVTAPVREVETWAEKKLLDLIALYPKLGLKVLPLFWGPLNFESASGYPWPFYAGPPNYDLVKEGLQRFKTKTQRVRDAAREHGIKLAHEIHPGTAAQCADDFLMLLEACDGDETLTVNFDPSHFWQGESWEVALRKVGPYVAGCHVKDHQVIEGRPLRSMQGDWTKRGMQFTRLGDGQLNLHRYAQVLIEVGYLSRYAELHGRDGAPLIGEAESAYYDLDATSKHACGYIRDHLCLELAEGSFEDGMGAK